MAHCIKRVGADRASKQQKKEAYVNEFKQIVSYRMLSGVFEAIVILFPAEKSVMMERKATSLIHY